MPAISQSSAQLSGGGGGDEKQIFPPYHTVLSALFIANCSPAFLQVCFLLVSRCAHCHLSGYPYCHFLSLLVFSSQGAFVDSPACILVDSGSNLFEGRLIDSSPAAILFRQMPSKVLPPSTACIVIACSRGCC